MRIDEKVEGHVRAAFAAVVGEDPKALGDALRALDAPDSETAVGYALFAMGYVVNDVFQGHPTADGLLEMAEDVVAGVHDWVNLGETSQVAALLNAVARGEQLPAAVAGGDVAGYAFIVGGFLLTTYRPDDRTWSEYLDGIWNTAETGPGSPLT